MLLLLAGLYFTVKTRFVQVRRFFAALSSAVPKRASGSGVSPFEAGCTALAATIGTGNIAGVSAAILLGGPGVLFWMWVSAFLGMAVKYAEILFALKYRTRGADGAWLGGPMISMERGLGARYAPLAVVWCILLIVSSLGMGCIVQVNTVLDSIKVLAVSAGRETSSALPLAASAVLALLIALPLLGGARRVGRVAAFLVPFMSLAYIAGTLAVLFRFSARLPSAFRMIIVGAFRPDGVLPGAGLGALTVAGLGLSRGMFTHEAGLGTSALAHSAAETEDITRQALFGVFEVFLDTVVLCTLTGLAILVSGAPLSIGSDAETANLIAAAFSSVFDERLSAAFLAVSMALFAFSSMLAFALYGERSALYAGGNAFRRAYAPLFLITILLSSLFGTGFAWRIADAANVLLAVPNLISLCLLSKKNGALLKR